MFVGTAYHQMDEKGRIRIPTRFKKELGELPFIMQGTNECLCVYPNEVAEKMLKDIFENFNVTDVEKEEAKALLMSSSDYGDEDKQGRTTISQDLQSYAGLVKDIVTVGAYDHVEIWDTKKWEEHKKGRNPGQMLNTLRGQK